MDAIFTAALEHLDEATTLLSFTKMSDKKIISEFGKRIDAFIAAVGQLGYPLVPIHAGDPKAKVALLRACVEYFRVVEAVRIKASARACDELADDYDLTRKEFFEDYMEPLVADRGGKLDAPADAFFNAFIRECRRPAADVFRTIFQNLPDDSAEDDYGAPASQGLPKPAPRGLFDAHDVAPAVRYDDPGLSGFQKRMMLVRDIML